MSCNILVVGRKCRKVRVFSLNKNTIIFKKNWKELFKLQPKWPSYEKRNVMEKPFCHILSKLGPTTSSRVEPINEDNNRINNSKIKEIKEGIQNKIYSVHF